MTDAASQSFIRTAVEPGQVVLRTTALGSDVVRPLDLELRACEIVAMMGKSGSGKSRLLRLLADLDPGEGEVDLAGRPREQWEGHAWRREVVYQSAEPVWWLDTPAAHFEKKESTVAADLAGALGLAPQALEAPVVRLSTGERQRLALIRSLLLRPRVLLLDEPTASLDETSTRLYEALLQKYAHAGMAILLVTHSREQALRLCDRQLWMEDGKLTSS